MTCPPSTFVFEGFYTSSSSNTSVTSSSQTLLPNTSTADVQAGRDDQDEVIGRMDEDNDLPIDIVDSTVNKMDDENSESPSANEESTTKQDSDDQPLDDSSSTAASLLTRVTSAAPTMPITISRNIDIPAKNDANISLSVMETSSLGRRRSFFCQACSSLIVNFSGADSMSPVMASSVDKKKRNRCTWPTCNKKLGLTGKTSFDLEKIKSSSNVLLRL